MRWSAPCMYLAGALLLAACGPVPVAPSQAASSDPTPELKYSNQTSLDIHVIVNGTDLATLAPTTGGSIDASAMPTLPWSIVAQTSGGRVLASFLVKPGDVVSSGGAQRGVGVRVDLSCGRLDLWSGPPLGGPAPGPGNSGDCGP